MNERVRIAGELSALADEVERALANEQADRQTICEVTADRLRNLAVQSAVAAVSAEAD
jgi:hypothetical protein